MVRDSADDFQPRKLINDDDLFMMSDYIPLNIRHAGIYPSYIKGYSAIFGAIAKVVVSFIFIFMIKFLYI
jgi:hypothetical protein